MEVELSAPKWILIGTVSIFSVIGIAALVKNRNPSSLAAPVEQERAAQTAVVSVPVLPTKPAGRVPGSPSAPTPLPRPVLSAKEDFPNIDRVFQLFSTSGSKLPIVETVRYSSSVPWLKGRPAWIADYAAHYNTSRHFIARSLNGAPDYFSQKVREGSTFNVFRKDKNIQFYLLIDVSRCKMGFYYVDLDTNERVLLKTYRWALDGSITTNLQEP